MQRGGENKNIHRTAQFDCRRALQYIPWAVAFPLLPFIFLFWSFFRCSNDWIWSAYTRCMWTYSFHYVGPFLSSPSLFSVNAGRNVKVFNFPPRPFLRSCATLLCYHMSWILSRPLQSGMQARRKRPETVAHFCLSFLCVCWNRRGFRWASLMYTSQLRKLFRFALQLECT